MQNILLIGAGRSASSLIKYLLDNSSKEDWKIVIGDISAFHAQQKANHHPHAKGIAFDVNDEPQRMKEIQAADLVISLLPAHLHIVVATDCVHFGKHLLTASYVSKEIAELNDAAKASDILLLNETGLDPGIDHMSAMQLIDRIKAQGGELTVFKSYTGGLIAPESNDNPWRYKFTWNPRNVVLAGQGTACYIENAKLKYVPYSRLFSQIETIKIEGHENFEGYFNRDSLSYRASYGLENIPTMIRGTLRNIGFCAAWNVFVKLGWTDDSYKISNAEDLSYAQLMEAYLPKGEGAVKQKLAAFIQEDVNSEIIKKIDWLGVFNEDKVKLTNVSPAEILQDVLERKWALKENDMDMIVMHHQIEYTLKGKHKKVFSSLVVKGTDSIHTAMAKTVGLPIGIAARLILSGKITARGVQIPTLKELYEPILEELKNNGIVFSEKESE